MTFSPQRVLVFAQHTLASAARSGVQRVVVESSLALRERVRVELVKWDEVEGQLKFFDLDDLNAFSTFAGQAFSLNQRCHRVNARFSDSIDMPERTWLLFPEIPYHMPRGNERFARILSQCREYGIRTAAIFYDLIPIREAEYSDMRVAHVQYVLELLRCDLVLPISAYSRWDLLQYLAGSLDKENFERLTVRNSIFSVLLGEFRDAEPWDVSTQAGGNLQNREPRIVLLGAVEPRKQQVRFLKIFNDLCETAESPRNYSIDIFGSLHPRCAADFHTQLARNPRIRYHQYAADTAIADAFRKSRFSVFASRSEGYGLPIVESLRHGVPCLTAKFGSMYEVAQGGGCLVANVLDDSDLRKALLELIEQPLLLQSLGDEIHQRPRRSWTHYVEDLLSHMEEQSDKALAWTQEVGPIIDTAIAAATGSGCEHVSLGSIPWSVRAISRLGSTKPSGALVSGTNSPPSLVVVDCEAGSVNDLSRLDLDAIASSDVLLLREAALRSALSSELQRRGVVLPLSDSVFTLTSGRNIPPDAASAIERITSSRLRAGQIATGELLLGSAAFALNAEMQMPSPVLAIVISTFNRSHFTELNVAWLLQVAESMADALRVVVVDNASTDDTEERLARFFASRHFIYRRNSANTGMLGNLHICSTLDVAPHVWLIGDDDFVRPDAVRAAVELLKHFPKTPLIVNNFAVYFRERVCEGDTPDLFFRESQPLARGPRPSGFYSLNSVAAEHDNLFTAIYPLVFRSDLLAACFNYPFQGVPFHDLIHSVPTTKYILEALRYTEVYWYEHIGITGNANNSWSVHRPRWHLVLMPKVIQLARDAGVSKELLWQWLQVHRKLFEEAVAEAIARGRTVHIDRSADVQYAEWIFREKVTLPETLRCVANPSSAGGSDF